MQAIVAFTTIVGAANVLTQAAEVAPYCQDWRGRYHGSVMAVIRPATTDEVSKVVQYCHANHIYVIPQGGNTGHCGGAAPTQHTPAIILSLSRLNHIHCIDTENQTITVGAGCTLGQIQTIASQHDRLFPLSLAAEGSCQIGGNLSTNAGGVQVLRYGNMRDLTLGLEVVLPDGNVLNSLSGLRKDNTGLDIKQLFIGAEGTLGIITAATLKLFPAIKHQTTALISLASPSDAVQLLNAAQLQFGDRLTAYELISHICMGLVTQHIPGAKLPLSETNEWYVLMEVSDTWEHSPLTEMVESFLMNQTSVIDAVIAQSLQQTQALWTLRESISEAQKKDGLSIKHDISVPTSQMEHFIQVTSRILQEDQADYRLQIFGHLGDGNLHFNVGKAPESQLDLVPLEKHINHLVYEQVKQVNGSISAEHGIGQLKNNELPRYADPVKIALMQQIKQALDPQGIMNPGKVYPSSSAS
ncbi:FAD-binding oxidoreductase [Leeia sp. TBRC 13508]|uniref:FAD-binding oxidoreductase n=1 Tax=Leeia speluncae TaxID=2884804 RepID=A0ABS8D4Y5_9NEIS|nr:FAD-binding oxidoreductase [Leeia speluncae]MCB6183177.1 FAD-binding oxidoreductase [Leeia speluncae]